MQCGELSDLFPNVFSIKQCCGGIIFMDRRVQFIVRDGAKLAASIQPCTDIPRDISASKALPRDGLEPPNQGSVHSFGLSGRWLRAEVADRQRPMIGSVVRPIDRQAHSHFIGARRSLLRFPQK